MQTNQERLIIALETIVRDLRNEPLTYEYGYFLHALSVAEEAIESNRKEPA